jgi:hypothetical protein
VYAGLVKRGRRALAVVMALALAGVGCATYAPRPSRHIAHDADDVYHRDGAEFRVGLFGGGAEALVAGDARALESVRRQQHLLRVGWSVYALGVLTMIVGGAVGVTAAPERAKAPALIGALGAGAVVAGFGFKWLFDAQGALVDAVNIYNDDVDAQARAERP